MPLSGTKAEKPAEGSLLVVIKFYTIYQYKCTIRYVLYPKGIYISTLTAHCKDERLKFCHLKSIEPSIYDHAEHLSTTATKASLKHMYLD